MTVKSAKYLAGSNGAPCTLRIPGVCSGVGVVPNHIYDRNKGFGNRASDLSVADGCFDCHAVFDRRRKMPSGAYISKEEWLFFALRGLQETQERRVSLGLLTVAGYDCDAPPKPKKVAPRKPKAERRKVQAGRPLESRPMRSRTAALNGEIK